MKFEDIIELGPIFRSATLRERGFGERSVFLQLCRWSKAGRIYPLRRGLYALGPPFQRVLPPRFFIANQIDPRSYVSMESALFFHGHLGRAPDEVTSVTRNRPGRFSTALGDYTYRYLKPGIWGPYREVAVEGFVTRVASPEKALLDWIHLAPGGALSPPAVGGSPEPRGDGGGAPSHAGKGAPTTNSGEDKPGSLQALGLLNVDALDPNAFFELARASGRKKLIRAVEAIWGTGSSEEAKEEAWFL